YALAAIDLDPQPLAVRFAAVTNGTLTFFVSHRLPLGSRLHRYYGIQDRGLSRSGRRLGRWIGSRQRHRCRAAVDPFKWRHELDIAGLLVVPVAQALEVQLQRLAPHHLLVVGRNLRDRPAVGEPAHQDTEPGGVG